MQAGTACADMAPHTGALSKSARRDLSRRERHDDCEMCDHAPRLQRRSPVVGLWACTAPFGTNAASLRDAKLADITALEHICDACGLDWSHEQLKVSMTLSLAGANAHVSEIAAPLKRAFLKRHFTRGSALCRLR